MSRGAPWTCIMYCVHSFLNFYRKNNMGRKWKKNRSGKPKRERPTTNYVQIPRENASFEKYYKAQKNIPENEWSDFMSCLKTDLPAVFRLTGSKSDSQALLNILQEKYLNLLIKQNATVNKIDLEQSVKEFRPHVLPWYPNNFGWQLNMSRKDIRSKKDFWKLHQFLISETETGNISRQEAVSMIPPLLLDVKSHHKILDMCAAPGSKTAQIIEYLHNNGDKSAVEGIVIANDMDNKRCYMLTHQTKRLQSETILVTNHDAAFMPNILHTRTDGSIGPMKLDRILCDVPCSGDGTLRKNFDIWGKWSTITAVHLHGLQLRIARRGLEMLAVGGRMVYSTCSMNPVENESVINRLLAEFGDSISLVDVKDQLPGLKYMPGISNWVVMNKELEVVEQTDAKTDNNPYKHLFPPTIEEAHSRNLDRCIRVLPHHQDTGCFFIGVLEKSKPLAGEKVYAGNPDIGYETSVDRTQRHRSPPKKKNRISVGFREKPFYFFNEANIFWPEINNFFKMKNNFDMTLLLRRADEGKGRTIYYANALVKDVITNNQERLQVINAGLKVLARCDNIGAVCNFRLAQEGLQSFLPYITGRRMTVQKNDLLLMLNCDDSLPPPISNMDPATQKIAETTESGSIAFIYEEYGENGFIIQLAGWKGNTTMRCYICKNDRIHYIRLLGGDTSNFERNKFNEEKLQQVSIAESIEPEISSIEE